MIRMQTLLLALALTIASAVQATGPKPLSVGYFELIPHSSFMDKTDDEGVSLQYFRLLAKKAKIENFELRLLPLIRLITMVSQNEADIALYLGKNSDRSKAMQFSSIPLFMMKPSLVVRKGRFKTNKITAKQLKKLNVCAWKEGYRSTLISEHAKEITEITGLNISTRCIEMVKRNRLDAFYSPDHLSLEYELLLYKLTDELEVIPLAQEEVGLYCAFSPATKASFIKHFEESLKSLTTEIPYEIFYQKLLSQRKIK